MSIDIQYKGFTLEIVGEYLPADDGGRDYPSSPATFECHEAWLGEYNITELLTGEQWAEIEAICMEVVK